jgi:hypothetical protein
MNTAFLDAINLASKIHHIKAEFADRSLLYTYESERKLIAENLLNFDAKYTALFSQRPPTARDIAAATQPGPRSRAAAVEENKFINTFKASCEFTSGYRVAYSPNPLNWSPVYPVQSGIINSKDGRNRDARAASHAKMGLDQDKVGGLSWLNQMAILVLSLASATVDA